jgi:hypoxanthine phosphoribosyltransferase
VSDKVFIRADELVRDSFRLARLIYDSGYRPTVILVLWRGGTPVGIAVHEFLLVKGVQSYHTVVKAESYTGIGTRHPPRIENLDRVAEALSADSRVLVIDDIFDSGHTLAAVRNVLTRRTTHIKVATLYLRTGRSQESARPDFHLRETDRWIVFPHELDGLTPEELRMKDPVIADVLSGQNPAERCSQGGGGVRLLDKA